MKSFKLRAAAIGLATAAALVVAPPPAEAASSCTGVSGYWKCYSTTSSPTYSTTVIRSWVLSNTTNQTVNASCTVTTSASYSSASSQSVTASVKAGLFGVAEATVSGTQTFTDTLTVSEATALQFSFKMAPGTTRTCRLIHAYYKVGTKYVEYSNYKIVKSVTGTTTVPYQWGLQLA